MHKGEREEMRVLRGWCTWWKGEDRERSVGKRHRRRYTRTRNCYYIWREMTSTT